MKNILLIMILLISFASMRSACATGWTVEIDNVRVWNTNKAEIIVKNPRSPNPAGTAWNCDYNIILIGNPVAPSLLALALAAWTENKSIRIDVEGSGAACTTAYIQTTT